MKTGKKPYQNIQDTMNKLRNQILDSYDYAFENTPYFENPDKLFYWLKLRTTYKKDPVGVELLQEMRTMFENNRYGYPGYGDCDCMTIATVACMAVNNWPGKQIIIVGNDKSKPQHIYAGVFWEGVPYTLDLTNPYINMERKYKYKQILTV